MSNCQEFGIWAGLLVWFRLFVPLPEPGRKKYLTEPLCMPIDTQLFPSWSKTKMSVGLRPAPIAFTSETRIFLGTGKL
jgi:hypothetical protein